MDSQTGHQTGDAITERLRSLAASSPAAFWSGTTDGLRTYASERWTEITGQPLEESLGTGWRDVIHPDDRAGVEASLRERDATDPFTWQSEHRVVRPDGEVRWVIVTGRGVHGADGLLAGYAGVTVDVTESRRQRDRLDQLAAQHAAIARLGRRALARDTSLDDLLRAAVETAGATLATDFAIVLRVDGDELVPLAIRSRDGELQPTAQRIPGGTGSQAGYAVLTGGPVVTDDTATERRFDTGALTPYGVVSSVIVPVASRGTALGALGVQSCTARTFTSEDAAFLESIANVVASLEDRLAYEEEQRRQALVDPLTGLANRLVVADLLERTLETRPRGMAPAAILLDVDHMQHVNEAYGQRAGDDLLIEIARRLVDAAGAGPLVARSSGDGFCILIDDTGTSAALLAERVLEAFGEPFQLAEAEVLVSASVGIATARGVEDTTADRLLRGAEAALGAAKANGRARWEWYDPATSARAQAHVATAVALRGAVQREELVLLYQPIVDLADRRPFAFEALLRWRRPGREDLVGPAEFIGVAEETGLIVPIGHWVIEEACRQLAAWRHRHPGRSISVSVNVSGRQLARPGFVQTVLGAIRQTGVAPDDLGLELTESVLIEESEAALGALVALREHGVRLLIDDFGTGYASLRYVKRFQPDILKLDRSFVAGLGIDGADTTIVAAVVSMAHALGLRVIAEGVERPEQVASLLALGVSQAQGFLFARPTWAARAIRLTPGSPDDRDRVLFDPLGGLEESL